MDRVPSGWRKLIVVSVKRVGEETEISTEEASDTSLGLATFSFFCTEKYLKYHHLTEVRVGDVIFAEEKKKGQHAHFASDFTHLVYVPTYTKQESRV